MQTQLTAPARARTAVRPRCWGCRDRGYVFVGDDDSLPIRRACGLCADRPTPDADFWGHALLEEPAGDVDDDGRFSLDGAA